MASTKSLQGLTDKQLESEWTKAAKELDKLKAQLKEYSQEHQRRAAEKRAAQALETMSDADRRALLQQLEAEGIESAENVGTPGGGN